MFRITFATATALLVAATFGASAHAGGSTKGTGGLNGTSLNGMSINGMGLNGKGRGLNGVSANGTNEQAAAASSFAIDGIELPAQVR